MDVNTPLEVLVQLCEFSITNENRSIKRNHWESVINLSIKHRVFKIAEHSIDSRKTPISEELRNQIKNYNQKATLQMLLFTSEISLITKKLSQLAIDVIPLKGPIAAKQIYDDFAAKNSRDIDLLVREELLEKCIVEIEKQGYINSYPFNSLSKKQKKAFKRFNNQLAFFHPEKKIQVEIHWRLFANPYFLPISFDELLKDSSLMVVGKATINCLSNEHLLLYLCAHGSKHLWSLLYWLLEVATLTQKVKFDWDAILREAIKLGVERPLVQGLVLIEKLFNLPAPKVIQEYYQQHKMIQNLVSTSLLVIKEEVSFSQETSVSNYWKILNYKMKLDKGIRYKLGYFKPYSINDFQHIKLPDSLFFGYFWLRPIFWFWRYVIHPIKKQ